MNNSTISTASVLNPRLPVELGAAGSPPPHPASPHQAPPPHPPPYQPPPPSQPTASLVPPPLPVTPTIEDVQIGYFVDIHKPNGYNVSLKESLNAIKTGYWAVQIARLRTLPVGSEERKQFKENLPAFMFSGTTTNGRHKVADVGKHSGLLQIDFDKLKVRDATISQEGKVSFQLGR